MNQYCTSQHGNTCTLNLNDHPPGQGRALGISSMREESWLLLTEPLLLNPGPHWIVCPLCVAKDQTRPHSISEIWGPSTIHCCVTVGNCCICLLLLEELMWTSFQHSSRDPNSHALQRCVRISFSHLLFYHLSRVCRRNPPHRVCVLSLYNDRAAGWARVGEPSAL